MDYIAYPKNTKPPDAGDIYLPGKRNFGMIEEDGVTIFRSSSNASPVILNERKNTPEFIKRNNGKDSVINNLRKSFKNRGALKIKEVVKWFTENGFDILK